MKLLFIHGGEKLKEDKSGNFYTDGSYTSEVWNRYLNICDELSVIFRKDAINYETEYAKQKFQFFDKDRINFIEIPDLNSSYLSYISIRKRNKFIKTIHNAILEHDYAIMRLPSSTGNIAIKYAKKYNKPYFIEIVGCPWDSLWNHSFKGKLLSFKSYLQMKKSVENAPYVNYVTSEFLQHRYPTKGKSIGCSDVTLPSLDESILESRLKKINYLSNERPIIIGTTAAVNVRYKGQEYVIKAIAKLNKEGYNFEYYLAGGGDNSYLKSMAEKFDVIDKVKFLGTLPHKKVFEYLDNIDIYIQPSKQEGLPRALVEAMSRACPSLGSNTGGIPELLNKKLIFHNGAVKEIYNLLKNMDKDTMITEAIRSFEKAKDYNADLLNKRRTQFLKEFVSMNTCKIKGEIQD